MQQQPQPQPQPQQQQQQQLAAAVRGYVHMDNLVESFNAQATNARTLRAKHETEAITIIKKLGLQKSTIKISGAALQLAQRRTPSSLTWTYLEREVTAWASAGGRTGQAESLLKWLHEHREIKDADYLKKTGVIPI